MLPLLSLSTEIIFWLVTVAIIVATVIFWHKFSIHKWQNITARFLLIIIIQCFALASMGITINRSGEFFDSWSDLFGTEAQYQKIALSPSTLSLINLKDLATATRTSG